MEEENFEGTFTESIECEDWNGVVYTCEECGQEFMTLYDVNTCYCPGCGKRLRNEG